MLMSKIGVQGGSLINIMLGFGCAYLQLLVLEHRRQKRKTCCIYINMFYSSMYFSTALISLLGDYSVVLILLLILANFILFIISAKL